MVISQISKKCMGLLRYQCSVFITFNISINIRIGGNKKQRFSIFFQFGKKTSRRVRKPINNKTRPTGLMLTCYTL